MKNDICVRIVESGLPLHEWVKEATNDELLETLSVGWHHFYYLDIIYKEMRNREILTKETIK